MKAVFACLLLGAACSSAPRRTGDSGTSPPPADGGSPVTPGVDVAPGMPIEDPPPGTPTARLMGFPLDIDFGTVNTGSAARSNGVVITNVGDGRTRPLEAMLVSATDLRLTSNCVGRQLLPGETCVVTAEFTPRIVGLSMATGSVDDGAGGLAPITFMARGQGRMGPDAGPDVARPMVDAGGDAPRVMDAGVDVARDVGVDVARDVGVDVARDLGVDPGVDARD
jgi:hypothetical protein